MMNKNASINRLRCDVLLFVATTTEKSELERAAKSLNIHFSRKTGRFGRYYDLGIVGVTRVLAVKTEMGPLSYRGSASMAIQYLAETAATGVISLGMAFGVNPQRQNIGDIIVSTSLLPYDNRDVRTENGKIGVDYSRVKPYMSKESLVQIFERESERDKWRGKAHFGAILTGAARIFCQAYRDELVDNCGVGPDPVVGGEMEGVGILGVSEVDDPVWIVVKGISDFADEARDDVIRKSRPVACGNSARFVLSALENASPDQ